MYPCQCHSNYYSVSLSDLNIIAKSMNTFRAPQKGGFKISQVLWDLKRENFAAEMMHFLQFLAIVISLDIVYGIGGPYPPTFDCPMRQLALQFAQEIQPWLTTTSLQQIADALNGYVINF